MYKTLCLLLLLPLLPACSTMGYYWEKVTGQVEIMNAQRPINEVLDDATVDDEVKQALRNIQAARRFAGNELNLPDNDSYKEYADLGRKYVVYTVVATPRYSVEAKEWCFLIVGCLSYRGYFNKDEAEAFASDLQQQDFDVYISGTRAYSTLGWFDDPVLNTMLYKSEAYRVGLIFHELAHQKIYVDDDTAFNEGFATAVELAGIEKWYELKNQPEQTARYLVTRQRQKEFNALLQATRNKLDTLYKSEANSTVLAKQKKQIFSDMKKSYQQLKQHWHGYSGYDAWMNKPLNNAHLALSHTYSQWVPAFRELLKSTGDFEQFYQRVEDMGEMETTDRHAQLQQYQPANIPDNIPVITRAASK